MQSLGHPSLASSASAETGRAVRRILFLEPQPCIRALKYAIALRRYLRDNIYLCLAYVENPLDILYGFGEEYFSKTIRLNPETIDEDMCRIIRENRPQIIHSHNAPDYLTLKAIDVAGEIPVVHDLHEVLSIHNSGFSAHDDEEKSERYLEEEKRACQESDGRIYATDGIRRYIQRRYNVNAQNDIVFHNYASESMMPRHFKKKSSDKDGEIHIVYIGCVTSLVNGSHYDLREIFRRIADRKIHIHIYPTSNEITKSNDAYRKLAECNRCIHCHATLDYRELLSEITQYDFGWAGFNGVKNRKHLQIALPNKVLEYVSSGLPVIAFPHMTIQRFIERYGTGLVINDIDELPETLRSANIQQLKENAMRSRGRLTVESRITKLVDLYRRLIETRECD